MKYTYRYFRTSFSGYHDFNMKFFVMLLWFCFYNFVVVVVCIAVINEYSLLYINEFIATG